MANISDAFGEWHVERLDGCKVSLEDIKAMIEYFNDKFNADAWYRTEFFDAEIEGDVLKGKLKGTFSADGRWSVLTNFEWLRDDESAKKIWKKFSTIRGFRIIVNFEEFEPGNWFFVPDGEAIITFKEGEESPSVEVQDEAVEPTKEVLRNSRWFSEDVEWAFYDWDTGEPNYYNDIIELDDDDRPIAIYHNLFRSGKYKDLIGDIENATKETYENFIKASPDNKNKLLSLIEEAREIHKEYLENNE